MFRERLQARERCELRAGIAHEDDEVVLVVVLLLAILVGVSLGLLGGGGSILTVPILSYVAGFPPMAAIAASLFVVGITSVAGVISHARAGRVRWRTGFVFGAAGMIAAFLGGTVASYIPAKVLMVAFGVMMAVTAFAMLRKRRALAARTTELPVGKVIALGALVGLVTGLIGVGGGFLVVPALVLLGGLAMEAAIGTSLVVIAMNSFAGLAGHLGHVHIDWPITLAVTGMAIAGSLAGGRLAGRVRPEVLRRGFGVFVIAMAVLVLAKELW